MVRPAKNLGSLLRTDHVLQNQARIVLGGQFGGKLATTSLVSLQADGTEDGAGGEVAVFAVDALRGR